MPPSDCGRCNGQFVSTVSGSVCFLYAASVFVSVCEFSCVSVRACVHLLAERRHDASCCIPAEKSHPQICQGAAIHVTLDADNVPRVRHIRLGRCHVEVPPTLFPCHCTTVER